MDFRLSDDQIALRDGLRQFCDGRFPVERLRELEGRGGFERAVFAELAEMGLFGLRLPESEGGVGLGFADAVVAFAELGRRLVPGPTLWTHLAAGLLPGAEAGETVVGGLDLLGPVRAPILVEHLEHLDALLVLREEGVFRIDPERLDAKGVGTPLDPHTPVHHVERLPEGERLAGPEDARRLRVEGAALASAFLLGIAEFTQELATEYAKGREQFGRPIGGFQAVKHILADMFVRQEAARAAAYAAGATLDDPGVGDVFRAVSAAKITCGDAAHRNSRACVQVHGGMGYTWEVPAHYYLKRAWVVDSAFGGGDEHSERIADTLAP